MSTPAARVRAGTSELGGMRFGWRETEADDAVPVVALHGMCSTSATWDPVAARLAEQGRRTVAVDLRGHGRSSRPGSYACSAMDAPSAGGAGQPVAAAGPGPPLRRPHDAAGADGDPADARPGLVGGLASVTAPTLLVSGGSASHVSTARQRRVAALLPHGTFESVAEAGHRVHSKHPDRFCRLVLPLLTQP